MKQTVASAAMRLGFGILEAADCVSDNTRGHGGFSVLPRLLHCLFLIVYQPSEVNTIHIG